MVSTHAQLPEILGLKTLKLQGDGDEIRWNAMSARLGGVATDCGSIVLQLDLALPHQVNLIVD